jgi:hypothetical protein
MTTKNTSPYIPAFLKAALSDTRPFELTFEELLTSNIKSEASFKYQSLDSPLKNTQQLNVDWSKFENHAFFSSAEVKTNVAFDVIINGFPFDGTKAEVEKFFEKITGFEKWVFDQFPKFAGQLHFSGTQINENPANGYAPLLGTYVTTKDAAGWIFPDISSNNTGDSVIFPPSSKSLTIEAQIFVPNQSNARQIIVQKQSPDLLQGFTLHLEPSTSDKVSGSFSIISGSVTTCVSASLQKGKFNHVCVTLNKESDVNLLQFYVDEELKATSVESNEISDFNDKSDLLIGSGSSFYCENLLLQPQQTFSGSLDELRIFHSTRSIKQQQFYATKGLFAAGDLKLYYRFNEPPEQYSNNSSDFINKIVLDSSGNSLHGTIANYTTSLRKSANDDELNPVTNERPEFKVILFPYHPDVLSLNSSLLTSASIYDDANPNLITKLIPRHYLREGALSQGYSNTAVEGNLGTVYSGEGIPGQGQLGSTQIMLTFLYIWAKFFDEIKMFVDAFRTLRTVDYKLDDTIPNNFLQDFIRSYGFYLPPFFNASNVLQYVEGEDIEGISVSDLALKEVQAQLLRRILINIPDMIRSKGTQHSVRAFLRSVGIDPDNSVRIREYGGPSTRHFGVLRETRTDVVPIVDFYTGSLATSQYLSASRSEPGIPQAVGPFVNGISSYKSDGLLTSGSWTFEGMYRFGPQNKLRVGEDQEQSLVRLETTGSAATAKNGLQLNIVTSGSAALYMFVRPGMGSSSPYLEMKLSGPTVFDGNQWNISAGCVRNDATGSLSSSFYFIRAASQNAGEITDYYATSSYFYEQNAAEGNSFRLLNASYNASGSILKIGNDDPPPNGAIGYVFLNDTLVAPDEARTTTFTGLASNIRFWSKFINENEWREHVRNYRSTGVDNPYINYNYVTKKSGSFERLRLRTMEKQPEKFSDSSGEITFLDFSENNLYMAGTNWPTETRVYVGDIVPYSYLSPYFDEFSTSEKIRIRSYQNEENLIGQPWANLAPVNELPPGETPLDDPRFSVEFSLIDSLNKDIVTMFSTFDQMSNAIGAPELMYSPDYPDLEKLRDIYFNRIKDKLNFRGFFEFYKWFDLSVSTFIAQLVPRKTKFKGTNFVVESHMLERHKLEYYSNEIYLGDGTRSRIRDVLLLQQIVGEISRY